MSRFELLNDAEEIMYEDASSFEQYPNEKIRLKLHTGSKYEQLKDSIIANGVLTPIIAMPSNNKGKLTVISGWNRTTICNELGLKVPYQLKTNLTQEQADAICIDTNLLNRQHEEFLPSELSHLISRKFEILNHQGKNDETSRNNCTKFLEEIEISRRTAQYYIRLTFLTDELLNMVDSKKLLFMSSVAISYLKQDEMRLLYEYITNHNYKITPKIAEELKKLSQSTEDNVNIKNIINEFDKSEEKIIKSVKLSSKELSGIIPKEDLINSKEIIMRLLREYYGVA